jgi:Alginate lyase
MARMPYKNVFLLAGLLLGQAALGQVSLTPGAVRHLKELIRADATVRSLFDSLRSIADAALQDDPNPIDTLRTEGLLQGDPRKAATWEALRDLPKLYALAVAYRVTRRQEYLDKASVFLIAWADSNFSRGDPIDETNLDPAIEAYGLISRSLVPGENHRISRWLNRIAQAEIHAPFNDSTRTTAHNNWNAHRLKIVGEIGFAIDDKTLQNYAIAGIKQHIGRNLLPDGRSEDFVSRDAVHYHLYDLEPLLKLAIVIKQATGVDYYRYEAPNGASIKKSVDWLLPYLDGRQTHAEFVNSTVEFDKRRAQNGESSYKAGMMFEPRSGVTTLLLAAYFDDNLLELARRLLGSEEKYPVWQAVLDGLKER